MTAPNDNGSGMSNYSNNDNHDSTYSHVGSDLDHASERPLTFVEHGLDEDDISDEDHNNEYTFPEFEEDVIEYADPGSF
ncbi:hypothetical protein E8E11_006389 [Didymella keratinophila]|nr:hypothetical protein E8E11_006389 [Didymella keratinophila]